MSAKDVRTNATPGRGFEDGLGIRVVRADPTSGDTLEVHFLCPELAAYERSIKERTSRLTSFRHARFAPVKGVETTDSEHGKIGVVFDYIVGPRLSEMLDAASRHEVTVDTNAALHLLREMMAALGVLHESRNVTHGAIGPERLILTPRGRLVITDFTLGLALERLQYTRQRLWRDFRIAMPPSAGSARFDRGTDVTQVGHVALALLIGCRLDETFRLKAAVDAATEVTAQGERHPLSDGLKSWLERATGADARKAFTTIQQAGTALEQVLLKEKRFGVTPSSLRALAGRFLALEAGGDPSRSSVIQQSAATKTAVAARKRAHRAGPPTSLPEAATLAAVAPVALEDSDDPVVRQILTMSFNHEMVPDAQATEDVGPVVIEPTQNAAAVEPASPEELIVSAVADRGLAPVPEIAELAAESLQLPADRMEEFEPIVVDVTETLAGASSMAEAAVAAPADRMADEQGPSIESLPAAELIAPGELPRPIEVAATAEIEPEPVAEVAIDLPAEPAPAEAISAEPVDEPAAQPFEPASAFVAARDDLRALISSIHAKYFTGDQTTTAESAYRSGSQSRTGQEGRTDLESAAAAAPALDPSFAVEDAPAEILAEMADDIAAAPDVEQEAGSAVEAAIAEVVAPPVAEPVAQEAAEAVSEGEADAVLEPAVEAFDEAALAAADEPILEAFEEPAEVAEEQPVVAMIAETAIQETFEPIADAPAASEIDEGTPDSAEPPPGLEVEGFALPSFDSLIALAVSAGPDSAVESGVEAFDEPSLEFVAEPAAETVEDPAPPAAVEPLPIAPVAVEPLPIASPAAVEAEASEEPADFGTVVPFPSPDSAEAAVAAESARRARPRGPLVRWKQIAGIAAALVVVAFSGVQLATAYWLRVPLPNGSISIESVPPGLEVFIDGSLRGNTPVTVTLAEGTHALEVKGRGQSRALPIRVVAGARSVEHLTWPAVVRTGSLRVESEPSGATVYLDGARKGTAPLTIEDVSARPHTIGIEGKGGRQEQRVKVEPETTTTVRVAVFPGWVQVAATLDLEVRENGVRIGSTGIERIMLPAGRHTLELVNEQIGFRVTRDVQVVPGDLVKVGVELPRGTVEIDAPAGVEIWLDGERVGETPAGPIEMAPGTHNVRLKGPGIDRTHVVVVTLKGPSRISSTQ